MNDSVKVKICGITRGEDAIAAAAAGADAIGFIFVRSSPRYIAPSKAAEIIAALPPLVTPVGVFVNAPRDEVERTVVVSGIRCLQLHGEEDIDETRQFDLPVIKTFRVSNTFTPASMSGYAPAAFLLDTYAPEQHGGTGRVFDWEVARKAKPHGRLILSGGLTPANALDAVLSVRPFAIDVSSGVEHSPGIKDHDRIAGLFEAVRLYHHVPQQEFLC